MKKTDLLTKIAEEGYNAGFGAKVCFASYDILRFAPGLISFLSMALGVLGLVFDSLSTKGVSAGILVIGLLSYYITVREKHLKELEESGKRLTAARNQLSLLHGRVKAANQDDLSSFAQELSSVQNDIGICSKSEQVIFSGWLAHVKFFGESQISWIDEELKFRFWRDKVPASLKAFLALVALAIVVLLVCRFAL